MEGQKQAPAGPVDELTELRREVARLRVSEEKYRLLVENATGGLCVFQEGKIRFVNQGAVRNIGYPEEELLSRSFIDFIHPDDREKTIRYHFARLEGKEVPDRYRIRIVTQKGDILWVEITGVAIMWDGKPATMNVLTDITDRYRMEETLRKVQKDLEGRMEERTAELKAANEQLRREIEERRIAEAALSQNEKLYRLLIENANDMIFVAQDGRLTFINQRLMEWTSLSKEELEGSSFLEWIHPDDQEMVVQNHIKRLAGEPAPEVYDFRVRNREGQTGWVSLRPVTITWKGRPATMNMATVITARKRAEEALRVSEAKYRTILQSTPHAVTISGLDDLRYLEVNDAFVGLTGYTREDVLGRTPEELNLMVDPEVRQEVVDQIRRQGGVDKKELQYRNRDGTIYQTLVSANPIQYGDINGLVTVITDITPLKEAQKELRQANEMLEQRVRERTRDLTGANLDLKREIEERRRTETALRESETRYRSLVDNIDLGVTLIGPDHDIIMTNAVQSRWFGKTEKEFVGEKCYVQFEKQDRVCPHCPGITAMSSGEPAEAETRWSQADGDPLTIRLKAFPQYGPDGDIVGLIELAEDITQRKLAEKQAQAQQEKLIQADKMISMGILVSGVAHEINNPNNTIMINSPILRESWENVLPILEEYHQRHGDFMMAGIPYSEMRGYIDKLHDGISDGSERIRKIVMSLKDFARKEEAEFEQDVDLNQVVQAALSLLSNILKKSTQNLTVTYDPLLPAIRGNFQRLEQVVVNLVQNACESLADPTKSVAIKTGYLEDQGGRVIVEVQDEGIGIHPEDMKYIWDPFFTTKRETGGTGLGLSVSSSIVAQHQGNLTFDSDIGRGTRAVLSLPAKGLGRQEPENQ